MCVCVGFVMCGCFGNCVGNMFTCIYCVLYCVYCVLLLFLLRIFLLICFVCTNENSIAVYNNNNEKLKENLETVRGKHSMDSLQKTAILGTSHIIRKVLQCEA